MHSEALHEKIIFFILLRSHKSEPGSRLAALKVEKQPKQQFFRTSKINIITDIKQSLFSKVIFPLSFLSIPLQDVLSLKNVQY